MNKDEKMIEDNKRKETEFEAMTHFDDPSIPHICVIPGYGFGAKTLYDANCQILADDEIVVKKSELARLRNLEINYEQVYEDYRKLEQERKSCRLIADDEIVIKKYEYMDFLNTRLNELKKQGGFVDGFSQGYEHAKQETARKILKELKEISESNDVFVLVHTYDLEQLTKKYGIELED